MSEKENKKQEAQQTISELLSNGVIIEAVYDGEKTQFFVMEKGEIQTAPSWTASDSATLIPVHANNNLIRYGVMLLPAYTESFGTVDTLLEEIQAYLHRYVDLTSGFERIASYYVLLTWVYDVFNEVPYLRLRGDFGSGKTRALAVIGSICYKAFFASGASTISPIFHILDTYRGTLVFDETDFRFSDEKTDIIKILNNGNVRGFPVLRTMINQKREFDPRAFNVFGPKIVAMRDAFADDALESRFITEEMGNRPLRADIPINLPEAYKSEALALRNKLLMYRFLYRDKIKINPELRSDKLSPRLNQILIPLFSLITDEACRDELRELAVTYEHQLAARRSEKIEGRIVAVLLDELQDQASVSIGRIASLLLLEDRDYTERPITERYVGSIVRNRLHLLTYKSHGVYVVPNTEREKVLSLAKRYGVQEKKADNDGR